VDNHRQHICNKLKLHGTHSLLKFAFDNSAYQRTVATTWLFDGTFFAFILPMLARDTGFNNILK